MRYSDTAKVGLTALAAVALLVWAALQLRGSVSTRRSYTLQATFPDAQGIQKGALVRVRGVDVGTVEEIGLTGLDPATQARKPLLTLRISNDYQIGPRDSFRINGGLLGVGQPFVEITPGDRETPREPGTALVEGEPSPSTDDLASSSKELLDRVSTLVGRMDRLATSLTRVVEDPNLKRSLTRTATNFEKVSESGVRIGRNLEQTTGQATRLINGFQSTAVQLDRTLHRADELLTSFRGAAGQTEGLMRDTRAMVSDTRSVVKDAGNLVRNTNTAIENAGGLVTDTRATLTENRERLTQLFENLNKSLSTLESTLGEARSFLGDTAVRNDLKSTAQNIREATENLKKITTDVQGLTGDTKVQEDLKATLTNLRDASEEAAEVFRRVRGVVGGSGKTAKSIGQRLSDTKIRSEVVRKFDTNRTRVDFDATIPWSDSTFYRFGFYDFGEATHFNGQMGKRLAPRVWSRYGVYASKLGLGLDLGNPQRPTFSADLFGVDRPRLNLRGYLPLTSYLDLTLGVDNTFRRVDPVIGVRLRQ